MKRYTENYIADQLKLISLFHAKTDYMKGGEDQLLIVRELLKKDTEEETQPKTRDWKQFLRRKKEILERTMGML